jgi:hypothetical protein
MQHWPLAQFLASPFERFGHLKPGTRPQGGESKRSADNFGPLILPFGSAQGGESFDFAQDREPVERPAEPFRVSVFVFRILLP